MADVGGIIAASHARRLDCVACGTECEPVIIARRTTGRDHFERLCCTRGDGYFRRIWIGGYR